MKIQSAGFIEHELQLYRITNYKEDMECDVQNVIVRSGSI